MANSTNRWDTANWTPGPVTLFEALGLKRLSSAVDWSKLSLQANTTNAIGQSGGMIAGGSLGSPSTGAADQAASNAATALGNAVATGAGAAGSAQQATNQQIGQKMAAAYGWTGQNWNDLKALWTRESGWNQNATNPSSGAYGIAQALGHGNGSATKGTVTNEYGGLIGNGQAQQANSGNAVAQIAWGLVYIKQSYGSPSAAWAHETQFGWY